MKYSPSLVTIIGLIGIGVPAIVVGALHTSAEPPPADHDRPTSRSAPTSMPAGPRLPEPARSPPGHAPAGSAGEAPRGPIAGGPRPDLAARAEHEREYQAYMAGIDAAFRAETTDPTWSSATSSIVRTALAADGDLRSLARNVECRSRTCRVEIADGGPGKLDLLLPMFAQRVGGQLPGALADRITNPTGATTIILYLSRTSETPANPRR